MEGASAHAVRRSEVFCSKIIHKQDLHQCRFTPCERFKRILEFSFPEVPREELLTPDERGAYRRPTRSPLPCMQCHRRFGGPPVFLPLAALRGQRTEWGNFCRPECANTYLHRNMADGNLPARAADLHEYCQDVYGWPATVPIGQAPHFSQLEAYGGPLTEEQFDALVNAGGVKVLERWAPFIPTPAVIEWETRRPGPLPPPEAGGVAAVDAVLGPKRDGASTQNQWEVVGLRQPSLEAIETRLLNLPQPEIKQGLYPLAYARKMAGQQARVADAAASSRGEAPLQEPDVGERGASKAATCGPAPPPPVTAAPTADEFPTLAAAASMGKPSLAGAQQKRAVPSSAPEPAPAVSTRTSTRAKRSNPSSSQAASFAAPATAAPATAAPATAAPAAAAPATVTSSLFAKLMQIASRGGGGGGGE